MYICCLLSLPSHPKNQKGPRYNRTVIEEHLLKLGALLMMARPPVQLHFDKFLTDVHPQFNVTDVMFRLTPTCTSILERCSWRGRQVPCDTLFATRVTPLGFCCVFNSRYYPVDANNQPHVLDLIGHNLGLGVVITENKDDFKYVRRNSNGAEMLLFEGSEYPLLESGDVRLYPVPRNNSLHFNIKVITQYAHDDIKLFSEKYRGCRTEGAGMSQCLAACQSATAAAICSCVPYTLHAALNHDERRVCSLRDVYCLNKHREKFLYLFPPTADKDDPQISEELQNGIDCPKCLVLCKRQVYWARVSYVQHNGGAGIFRNFLTEGLRLINSTTIRMFYASDHYERFALEPYVRWYEVLAILSTEWMALAGTSVVVILEVVYYFTFRWIHHFIRRKRLGDLRSHSM
ncbi:unnamed protein product [Arctia plantaginis]|uniref:Sodium channel protein Nach n=1 Tax=Arctia plantaginis TaxID=874455 RepID=A0A8S0YLF7_ARCPL|nr:unnamed protein product [Arctia plantaginis]